MLKQKQIGAARPFPKAFAKQLLVLVERLSCVEGRPAELIGIAVQAKEPFHRERALKALRALIGKDAAMDEMIKAVALRALKRDDKLGPKLEAMLMLKALPFDAEVGEALVHALDDKHYYVREKAAEAMAELGPKLDEKAVQPLIDALAKHLVDERVEVRLKVIEALIELLPKVNDDKKQLIREKLELAKDGCKWAYCLEKAKALGRLLSK